VELQGNVWKIYLRAYPFDDTLCHNIEKIMISKLHSSITSDDNFALLMIAGVLMEMGNYEKAEQIYQQTSLSEIPIYGSLRNWLKKSIDLYRMSQTDRFQPTELKEILHKMKESMQQLKQLVDPNHYRLQNTCEIELKRLDLAISLFSSSDVKPSDVFTILGPLFPQMTRQRDLLSSTNEMILNDSSINDPMELTNATSQDNETFGLINCDEMQFAIDRNFVKNDPRRIGFQYFMANSHKNKEEYDNAIKCLRDALLIPGNNDTHPAVYNELAEVYEKQRNWPAALESYNYRNHRLNLVLHILELRACIERWKTITMR
jgi:tetratricopeptide (TPR) repeat protein